MEHCTKKNFGWEVYECNKGTLHVVPTNDDFEHKPCDCPCHPEINEDGTYVHNSWDGREKIETGERKLQ